MKVTLTFDNGPEPQVTPSVLDCLSQHNLKATFFVLGQKVSDPACARIARRAIEEGHRIGNHTFTHTTPLGQLDRSAALEEFDRTEQALARFYPPDNPPQKLFRPYGGGGALGPHLLHPAVLEKTRSRRLHLRTLEFRAGRLARSGRLGRPRNEGLPVSSVESRGAARSPHRRDGAS